MTVKHLSALLWCSLMWGAAACSTTQQECSDGPVTRSVIGLEQAGASSADGSQKLFVDVFRSAPMNARGLRWWADVRIASFPEEVTTAAAHFNAVSFIAKLPVNKLAQFGEFRAGMEQRVWRQEQNMVGVFADFGALGNIGAPAGMAQVFVAPPAGTPQANLQIPPGAQYIAFAPPDRNRAYLEYAAGLRLTTRFIDAANIVLPQSAMFSVAFGQNEAITAGKRRGIVGTFEGFYPLPLPGGAIYVFGRADLRLGHSSALKAPIALAPAEGVLPSDPGVAMVALPSNRDLYSVGVGIDAIQLIASLTNKAHKK